MSWQEKMREGNNPGKMGTVKQADLSGPRRVNPVFAIVKFGLFFAAMVAFPLVVTFQQEVTDPKVLVGSFLGLLAYVTVSTVFTPEPDMSNIGMAGGLIDDPNRYSDDVNRNLMFLLIFTGPGRFLGSGVVDMYHLIVGKE